MEKRRYLTKVLIINVAFAFLINFVGKFLASALSLPFWFDCLGTMMIAYAYGPLCGGIVGLGLNIAYGLFDPVSMVYAIVSSLIGIACGFLARRKMFDTFFGTLTVGAILTLISVMVSFPLNMIFFNGYNGNIFGNGVFDMLREMKIPFWISSFMGELCVDYVDKNLLCMIVFFSMKAIHSLREKEIVRQRIQKHPERVEEESASDSGNPKVKVKTLLLVFLILVSGEILSVQKTYALSSEKIRTGFYATTVFNKDNGLIGGEANDVAFTKDGFLWIGTYSGLYQYDGKNFTKRYGDEIKNVNCLFVDEEGRLWIGTNDSGLAIRVGDKITNVLTINDSLSSNSVKCITQDASGNYYIGTSSAMNVIQIGGGVKITNTIREIDYACNLDFSYSGYITSTTNSGVTYILKNGKVFGPFRSSSTKEFYNCSIFDRDGTLLIGTSESKIKRFKVLERDGVVSLDLIEEISTKNIKFIKSLHLDENERIWICADNGAALLENNEVTVLKTGEFSSSIDNMSLDYQGNLWFTSSRLGLMRICESVFSSLYDRSPGSLDLNVVNAVTKWNGIYYFGTDNGIDAYSSEKGFMANDSLSKALKGARVRNFCIDKNNHLWIATSSGEGLWDVSPDGKIHKFLKDNGTISNRFRSVIQLKDGTMAAAENNGIDFIRNGVVASRITRNDGLENPLILSLYESQNGILYAGTDGGGIAEIRDGKFVRMLREGLTSRVILRICGDYDDAGKERGIFLVVGDGINYIRKDGTIFSIKNFPYSNNFDIIPFNGDSLGVLSSAGIYVVDKKEMVEKDTFDTILLDSRFGLGGSFTSNSWSYLDDDGKLFLCCDNGTVILDTNNYIVKNSSCRMFIDYVSTESSDLQVSRNHPILVSGDAKSLSIMPAVLNYNMSEPYVGYKLEGFEREETIVNSKELSEIHYINLPNGNYTFTLKLYAVGEEEPIETISYLIVKEMRIFDHIWFIMYFAFVCILMVGWTTWFIAKNINDKKIREAENNLRMSNETILAIAKTVDAKDSRTSQHSTRVSEYSVLIARKLGWSEKECEDIRKMGLLHDIGKIGIPDSVLNKPDKLNDEEYLVMKTHVERGAEILKDFSIVKNVDMGAKYHHERWDGMGYPIGLKGLDIPIYARIIGIADAFDAMTSNRVYRNRLCIEEVMSEMKRCRGSQFDPNLLDIFISLLEDKTIDVEALYR